MNESEQSTFADRLNLMLNRKYPKKIKKIDLAHELYVTPQTVSRWCNGTIIPDRGTIDLIINKVNELYGFIPNSPECYRSEWLAGESNVDCFIGFSSNAQKYIIEREQKKEL